MPTCNLRTPITAVVLIVVLCLLFFTHEMIPSRQTIYDYIYVALEQDRDILDDINIAMDDVRLINIVRKRLVPPSLNHYNFANKEYLNENMNPSAGQTQAVESILRGFGSDGFYLECGANDGEWLSNTIWLERTLGWKGLMIEADPDVYAELLPFYVDRTGKLSSGLTKTERYYAEDAVDVQCFPLYTVLMAINRITVDFFSLDVEGSELDILRTPPFDKAIFI